MDETIETPVSKTKYGSTAPQTTSFQNDNTVKSTPLRTVSIKSELCNHEDGSIYNSTVVLVLAIGVFNKLATESKYSNPSVVWTED